MENKKFEEEVVLVDTQETMSYAVVPSFNYGKFNVGDKVSLIYNDNQVKTGTIVDFVDRNEIEQYFDLENADIVGWKLKPVELITSCSLDDGIENEEAAKRFRKGKNASINLSFLNDLDVFLGMKVDVKDTFDLEKAIATKTVDANDVSIRPLSFKENNNNTYICFFNKKAMDEYNVKTAFGYKFKDIIDFALNTSDTHTGLICILSDKDMDALAFTNAGLMDLKRKMIIDSNKELEKLSKIITPEEADYLGKGTLEVIAKYGGTDEEETELKKHFNCYDNDELFEKMKDFARRLSLVIWCNY